MQESGSSHEDRERFQRVADLFDQALERQGLEREAFLAKACAADPKLRDELVSLLRVYSENDDPRVDFPFLRPPGLSSETLHARINNFVIERCLGVGGMGIVYLAEQEEPRRKVALKLIKLGMDTKEVLARFAREQRTLAALSHNGVARVYETGTSEDGRPYFAMEYVPGKPINHYCDQRKLDIPARLRLFLEVCMALEHAHQRGVVHRDIKPSNLLVMEEAGQPVAKVIDFGVAKAISQDHDLQTFFTEVGRPVGTPAYMSPEQTTPQAGAIDARSDVYSLGVILYELLVGELPLDREVLEKAAHDEVGRAIREDEPVPPGTRLWRLNPRETHRLAASRSTNTTSLNSQVRGDLDWITMRAIEKEPERRYPSACALAEDVQRYLEGLPVLAGPPSLTYRVRKFARKNLAAVVTAVVVFTVLVVGLAVTSVGWRDATRARLTAELARRAAEEDTYRALISAAHNSILAGDRADAERNLGECRDQFQGLEWEILKFQLSRASRSTELSPSSVTAIVSGPDDTLTTVSEDGLVVFVDWQARKLGSVRTPLELRAVAYEPTQNHLAAVGLDRSFHPYRGGIVLLDATTRERVWERLGEGPPLRALVFDERGEVLYTAGDSRGVVSAFQAHRAADGKPLALATHEDEQLQAIARHPTRSLVATGSESGVVVLWRIPAGVEVARHPRSYPRGTPKNRKSALSLRFSPDGRQLASSYADGSVYLFDAATLDKRWSSPEALRHTDWATSVVFSHDGSRFLTTSDDDSLSLWTTDTRKRIRVFQGHASDVNDAVFHPDGDRLASVGSGGFLKIWNPLANDRLPGIPTPGEAAGRSDPRAIALALSRDERLVAAGRYDGYIDLYEVNALKRTRTLTPPPGVGQGVEISFSAGGDVASAYKRSAVVFVWSLETGALKQRFVLPCSARIEKNDLEVGSLAFHPSSPQVIAVGGSDGCLLLFNAETGQNQHTFEKHEVALRSLAFSPDGKRLASGYADGQFRFWSMKEPLSNRPEYKHTGDGNLRTLVFSPDGRWLAGCGETHSILLWDVEKRRRAPFEVSHSEQVRHVFFTVDGTRILLEGGGKLLLCKLKGENAGKTFLRLTEQDLGLHRIAVSRSGRRLVGADGAGRLEVLDTSLEKMLALWRVEARRDAEAEPGN